ncbi:hypothetical protein MKL09_26465 [Methylobacterium sp. J-048]|uniref:hypothetical protein n=1 Tax=Methylobacterium sp. J-048 TaxID=2836635 RepID=UPI001FBBA685|nr:hypothetical protein [Methylobacterium sp. J-048]MCJ2060065.1 hypothetical protein [Methylobacterium sp. J-048]
MSEGIVPLRRSGEERSPIARVDIAAVELLVSGEAISLQTARAEVILKDLRAQRDQMSTLLADLRARGLIGDAQIDEVNASLISAINQGIVQIDLFIAQARVLVKEAQQTDVERSLKLGSAP